LDLQRRAKLTEEAQKDLDWRPPTAAEDEARLTKIVLLSVVCAMYVTPMAIGNNFAVLAYYWLVVHGIGTGTSGTLMAVGECLGVVVLYAFKIQCIFESSVTFPFGSPMNICCTSFLIAMCCFCVTLPNVYICAVGSIGVHMLNAAVHSFTNELCAIVAPPEEFGKWQGWAYLAKRASNCTMGLTQTLLFTVSPQLPYFAAGSAMLGWSVISGSFYLSQGLAPLQLRNLIRQQEDLERRLMKNTCPREALDDSSLDIGIDVVYDLPEDFREGSKQSNLSETSSSRRVRLQGKDGDKVGELAFSTKDGTTESWRPRVSSSQRRTSEAGGGVRASVRGTGARKSLVQEAFMDRLRQREFDQPEQAGRPLPSRATISAARLSVHL
jgi:hypothetical protein